PPPPRRSPLSLHDALPISSRWRVYAPASPSMQAISLELGLRRIPAGARAATADCCAAWSAIVLATWSEPIRPFLPPHRLWARTRDRKSTRLNSSHLGISYA